MIYYSYSYSKLFLSVDYCLVSLNDSNKKPFINHNHLSYLANPFTHDTTMEFKVGALCPVQQPESYWDRSSPMGLETTQR